LDDGTKAIHSEDGKSNKPLTSMGPQIPFTAKSLQPSFKARPLPFSMLQRGRLFAACEDFAALQVDLDQLGNEIARLDGIP